ncbi:TolC family outer membrane protein [Litorisediminicola beolgyonensis]|uniref:TolC family outer membrane protein n=1 Tax=Litorisediminicola beolgyonensis TaxID=1173614 RepID=A0ABW3ZEQ8_9RHOB
MIPRRFLRPVVAAFLSLAAAQAAQSDTLADALVGAYKTSGLIDQNRAVLRAADEDVAQAVAELRPVLNWSAEIQREYTKTFSGLPGVSQSVSQVEDSAILGLSAEWTVYDFGRNKMGVDVAKEAVLVARDELISTEQQVFLRATEAFFELRRALLNVDLRQSNNRLIQQELRAARDRFEVGEVTRTDVSLAEARLAATRSALAVAQGNVVIAQEEYLAAVGSRPGPLQPPSALPSLPGSVDAATGVALRTHPEIRAQQRRVTLSELGIAIAKLQRKPTVTLQGRAGFSDSLDGDAWAQTGEISLGATGPIYRGGELSSLVRQAMAERDQQRALLLQVTEQVRQTVANAYVQLNVARANIAAGQNQVRASRVAFEGVREEATLGARTTLDVLDAEQELLDARTTLISATVDEYLAAYNVLAAIGQLTAEDLRLPVQRYDPTEYYKLVKDAPFRTKQGDQLDRVLKALGKE